MSRIEAVIVNLKISCTIYLAHLDAIDGKFFKIFFSLSVDIILFCKGYFLGKLSVIY